MKPAKKAKEHASDHHAVEVGNQKQAVVHLEIDRRRRKQDACHAADAKIEHKGKKPEHRRGEMDASSKFSKEPVEDLDACGDRNQHRHDAEKGVDIGACAHGKEVMQPDDKGKKCDDH